MASTSGANVSAYNSNDDNRRPHKRARYSSGGSRHRQRLKFPQPYLGFEEEKLKPVTRSSLNVDTRFLPHGLHPGTILEIKGPDNSGKTVLLTYLIVRVQTAYPDKKVVLIDTRHKFNVNIYLSMICHIDRDLHHVRITQNSSISEVMARYPKLAKYLDRLLMIKCYTSEELLMTLGPSNESVLEKLLLSDPTVSLVAIDSIDNFSYSESLQKTSASEWPSLMQNLKQSVCRTMCPVISTTLISANKHEYFKRRVPNQSRAETNLPTLDPFLPTLTHHRFEKPDESPEGCKKCVSNVLIDYSAFTNILEIVPAREVEKLKLTHPKGDKINHYASAYLRSKHSMNTAGSGGNHRVKFSIFSDMLWVDEN